MKISLLTDAPKHNLALMKLSAYHKACGDQVSLNMPILPADYRYASVLFERNIKAFHADEYGGPAIGGRLSQEIEKMRPDYSLYNLDYSLGYTFRPCFNSCGFCKVLKMDHPDSDHHSIFDFHDSRFKKICLLNNNTFQDSKWMDTFDEISSLNLTVIDENGYDLRLITYEKAIALKSLKFQGKIHFAWDRMQDEQLIVHGLEILKKHKILGCHIYVLIGYDTTEKEDLHRCEVIRQNGQDPYIMPYNRTKAERRFKRFIDSFMWRKYKTMTKAWENYSA